MPSGFVDHNNSNSGNNSQGTPTSRTFNLSIPRVNIMDGNDIKLLIFNSNWVEEPEKHWFLCEVVWTMQQVKYEAIKRA